MESVKWSFEYIYSFMLKTSNMDKNHPRVCASPFCSREIKWKDYLQVNCIHAGNKKKKVVVSSKLFGDFLSWYRYLKKLWKNERVRILCCDCFSTYDTEDNYKFLIRKFEESVRKVKK